MPMAKRARGQHLTEKSATVEPSKQAENKPFSSPSNANNKSNSNITVTSNYNPSRRLALFQLGTDIPQSQFLSGDLAPARSSEVAEQDVLEWVENDKRRTHASCNVRTDIVMLFLDMDPKTKPLLLNLLIENHEDNKYDNGNGFLHFGTAVTREPGPVKGGITIIAFVEDPMATNFYKKARSNQCCKKSAEAVKLCGGKIVREPGPIPVINTKITGCLDPEGWRSVFGATSHAKEEKSKKQAGEERGNSGISSTKVFTVKRPPPSSPLCEEATSSEKVLIDHPSEDPPRDPIAKSWLQVESTNDDLPSDKE
ncbi:hypothetical protein POTOM_024103 [Populus tomentosa]|uniref:Uncharacterized protein n=1 Tax=Populus tomentosa TaxID=118781 RepID=A0A8X8D007_POPTO|nr:hypothetical protein POTOM_024103 [Populus tomentosa]